MKGDVSLIQSDAPLNSKADMKDTKVLKQPGGVLKKEKYAKTVKRLN